jgi:hypothetical protein
MNKICKNCKYFSQGDYNKIGFCANEHFVYETLAKDTPINGLSYWDYECYAAGFYVGEEFGCIHFCDEVKE